MSTVFKQILNELMSESQLFSTKSSHIIFINRIHIVKTILNKYLNRIIFNYDKNDFLANRIEQVKKLMSFKKLI